MSETSDQLVSFNRFDFQEFLNISLIIGFRFPFFSLIRLFGFDSELVIIFLRFLYDQDPVRQLLELSEVDHNIEIEL